MEQVSKLITSLRTKAQDLHRLHRPSFLDSVQTVLSDSLAMLIHFIFHHHCDNHKLKREDNVRRSLQFK